MIYIEKRIIEQYRVLAKDDSKSMVIENNGTLKTTIGKIWNIIMGENDRANKWT